MDYTQYRGRRRLHLCRSLQRIFAEGVCAWIHEKMRSRQEIGSATPAIYNFDTDRLFLIDTPDEYAREVSSVSDMLLSSMHPGRLNGFFFFRRGVKEWNKKYSSLDIRGAEGR